MARLVEYTPQYFEPLQQAVGRMGRAFSLCHRPFVDYYYATRDWCRLYLFLADDQTIQGTIGVDRMRFESGSREMTVGFGSNFNALRPGVGGYLFMKWMRSCSVGMAFGGSADLHRLIRTQQWTYFEGPKAYFLNSPSTSSPEDVWWVALAKWGLAQCFQRRFAKRASRIPSSILGELSVQEEHAYTEDLLPRSSPFVFRFAPTIEYLSWRYGLDLSFVRYRLFRVLDRGRSAGYVIINESPERVLVAQCDGEDASTLAYGVLLSLLELARDDAKPRGVVLSCCHPEMLQIYQAFGFRAKWTRRPFAMGGLRRPVDVPADTSDWLINYDWGDNGLRAPFRDQAQGSPEGAVVRARA